MCVSGKQCACLKVKTRTSPLWFFLKHFAFGGVCVRTRPISAVIQIQAKSPSTVEDGARIHRMLINVVFFPVLWDNTSALFFNVLLCLFVIVSQRHRERGRELFAFNSASIKLYEQKAVQRKTTWTVWMCQVWQTALNTAAYVKLLCVSVMTPPPRVQ